MNKFKIDILSYIRTILFTIGFACIFTGGIIYHAQNDVLNNAYSNYNDKALQEYIKNIVISQNQDLEYDHPEDYRIDIHLGYLHKVIKEYDKAETYYLKAVQKAPSGIYRALYELADFYIERERYDDARDILDSFPQVHNTPLLKYQSYLYRKLGDAFYKEGQYGYALNEYEKSLYYWTKLKKPEKEYIEEVNAGIYNAANNLADLCINNDKVAEGITYLYLAEKAKPRDYNVRYKIALATAATDPEKAYKYFEKLFKEDPTRIDFIAYRNILNDLIIKYESEGNDIKAKLFKFRAENLEEYVQTYLIYPRDIDFRLTNVSLYRHGSKCKIFIKYNLQNVSENMIKHLAIDVVYKLDGRVIETYSEKIVDENNYLYANCSIKDGTIIPKLYRKYKPEEIPKLTAEIYLYKYPDKKICIFNDVLFDKSDVKIKQSKHSLDCHTYIKFFASQILNFGNSIKTYRDSL